MVRVNRRNSSNRTEREGIGPSVDPSKLEAIPDLHEENVFVVGVKPPATVSGNSSASQSFAKDLAPLSPLPERVGGRGPSSMSLIKKHRADGRSSCGARKSSRGSRRASWDG